MSLRSLVWVFLVGACGRESAPPTPPPVVTTPTPPEVREPEPGFAIHEWGLIGVHYEEGPAIAATGPGLAAPEGALGRIAPPFGNFGTIGKPVIYVHLDPGIEDLRFDLKVDVPSGAMVEHFPRAEAIGTSVHWYGVHARPGSCRGQGFPLVGQTSCVTPDRYCEAAELPRYETNDAACLELGGERWNHLFYRGQVERDRLPIAIAARPEGGYVVRNTSSERIPGKLIVVGTRTDDRATTRIGAVDPPAPGGEIALPTQVGEPGDNGATQIDAMLTSLGLTASEVEAFDRAWRADLFGYTGGPPASVELDRAMAQNFAPRELAPSSEAVLYFLPQAIADREMPLTVQPAPRSVTRAILVRIDMTDRAPARRPARRR